MNNRYAIYTSASGEIQFAVNANADEVAAAHCELDQSFARAIRPFSSRDYVDLDTGNINQRPMTLCTPSRTEVPADGESAVILFDLEPGTSIAISGPITDQWTVDDGTDEITFSTAGEYRLTVQAPFPAKEKEIIIYAT